LKQNSRTTYQEILHRIEQRTARVVVAGMGYVGLALAVELAREGYRVTGLDVNAEKVDRINRGDAELAVQSAGDVREEVRKKRLTATTDPKVLAKADCISICVPTPLNKTKDPDVSFILDITHSIRDYLRPGQLIVLESTTYPGTTRELVLPHLLQNGLQVGKDFFLCYSPERVDPGNPQYGVRNTPKVVGGITRRCAKVGEQFYRRIAEQVVSVSSTETAEMTKLLENTFRIVNIGLVNELAIMCDKLNIDVWEVIDTAATKPFGYMKFQPGPGLGGHCIPVDPHYLSWKLRSLNYKARFIELAGEVNSEMPEFVVRKIADGLNDQKKSLNGSNILVLGLAYKADVDDIRESPALDVFAMLQEKGAHVVYHDPHISCTTIRSKNYRSRPLTPKLVSSMDCVVVTTDHAAVDYDMVAQQARLIVDSRNVYGDEDSDIIVRL